MFLSMNEFHKWKRENQKIIEKKRMKKGLTCKFRKVKEEIQQDKKVKKPKWNNIGQILVTRKQIYKMSKLVLNLTKL